MAALRQALTPAQLNARAVAWLTAHGEGFFQFLNYAIIGVLATCVQTGIFYVMASTCFPCLAPDDWAVRFLGLPSASFTGSEAWYASRGTLAAFATAAGFAVANVFCWLLNRAIVFKPGRYRWYAEFALFFGAASFATAVALGTMKLLIDAFGMMTTLAVFAEVVVSFAVNFFARKFVIFRG